jgi:hypothetical protein
MSLRDDQKKALDSLYKQRNEIENSLKQIEEIIKVYFPEEYHVAYQHWIPQIITALNNDSLWLSRGQYSLQDTIDHINDFSSGSGVNKYII